MQRSPFLKPALAGLLVAIGLFGLQRSDFLRGDLASHAPGAYGYGYGYGYREMSNQLTSGAGPGGGPHVRVFNASTHTEIVGFMAYVEAFHGGVNIARGDTDGDGVDEIITGAAGGGGPHVRVFENNGAPTNTSFMAYSPAFGGGVQVAAADLTGDGKAEIITAVSSGGGPHVRVFKINTDASVTEVVGFMAYAPVFEGGVRIAVGDIDGDDKPEIITGAGPGAGAHVRAFEADGTPTSTSFSAYGDAFRGGVNVARGDIDGQGVDEIITGPISRGGPHVRVFNAVGVIDGPDFMAFSPNFTGGVRVAAADLDNNGTPVEIIVGAGPGGGPHLRVFNSVGVVRDEGFFTYSPQFTGGITVAGGDA